MAPAKLLKIPEAAARADLSVKRFNSHIAAGDVAVIVYGPRTRRVLETDLIAFIERSRLGGSRARRDADRAS